MTDQTGKDSNANDEPNEELQQEGSQVVQSELADADNSTSSDETPEEVVEPQSRAPQKDQSKQSNRLVILVLIITIVLFALAALGGWWIWNQSQQQLTELKAQNRAFTEQVAAAQSQITEVSNRRISYADDISTQVARVEALVVQSAQRMNRQADQTENRWPLEEALTLTRLAQRRLFLDKDAAVSISLLKSADEILSTLDAAAVLPLREQIAKDILALNSAKSIDLNGTYFQLAAIADAVRQLTWLPKPALSAGIAQEANVVEGFWQSIKQVVVVTRMDDIVQAPPLQSDFELWRQHTLMVLAQAQLALLAQNQTLYEAALQQIFEQLSQMKSQFDFTAFLEQLTVLQAYQLNPVWPDIGNSVNKINDYIRQQNETEESATEEAQS